MNGMKRNNLKAGLRVIIVLKEDQRSGKLTTGIVKDILTNSPTHPHGIKVRLESGEIGRVKKIEDYTPTVWIYEKWSYFECVIKWF